MRLLSGCFSWNSLHSVSEERGCYCSSFFFIQTTVKLDLGSEGEYFQLLWTPRHHFLSVCLWTPPHEPGEIRVGRPAAHAVTRCQCGHWHFRAVLVLTVQIQMSQQITIENFKHIIETKRGKYSHGDV